MQFVAKSTKVHYNASLTNCNAVTRNIEFAKKILFYAALSTIYNKYFKIYIFIFLFVHA